MRPGRCWAPSSRGAYVGATMTVVGVAKVVGPAALTFLAIGTGGWGWWVIAGVFAATALVVRPVMSWVERTPRNPAVHQP
jgi:MFS family permease